MTKINYDSAQKEITQWLDAKRISEAKRESQAESIETLITAVQYGALILRKEDNVLIQELQYPTSGDEPIKHLEFKSRLKVHEVHRAQASDKTADSNSIILSYVSALTGVVKGTLKHLDTDDYKVAQSIAIFFL